MKIALLAPAGAMHRYNGDFGISLHYAPLTLTTLAALVPLDMNAEVVIYDETAGEIPCNIEADLIGITAITGTSLRAYAYADYFRSKGKTVVLGGVHPTLMTEEAMMHADAVVTGFAEQSWPNLLNDFQNNRLQKIYRQDDNFTIEKRPHPRRELLNKKRYVSMNTVEAVRGCHLPCNFCAYPAAFGKNLYKRPIREVIEEIEKLKGIEVLFPDINLIADREYAKKLFSEMIPLKKWWFGLTTSDVANDHELFKIIVKSGCKGLLIGFESVAQSAQQFVGKRINKVNEYQNLINKLHTNGIGINGCFAFGSDEEDNSVFEQTVDMIIKLKIDLPRYSILTPFPGTRLYQQLEAENRIIEKSWAMFDVEHCVFKPLKMTRQELEEGIEWAWNQTYSYLNIFKRLATFGTPHIATVPANVFGYKNYAKRFKYFTREVMTDNSDIFKGAE